jgi:hypothetical protein
MTPSSHPACVPSLDDPFDQHGEVPDDLTYHLAGQVIWTRANGDTTTLDALSDPALARLHTFVHKTLAFLRRRRAAYLFHRSDDDRLLHVSQQIAFLTTMRCSIETVQEGRFLAFLRHPPSEDRS